jgi:DNA-binding beta-propeller fold protein YncE
MSRALKFAKLVVIASLEVVRALSAETDAGVADSGYELKPINLPGATGAVALDYFAYDSTNGKVWVPASNLGAVDVIDEKTDSVAQIAGFKTGEVERRGRKVTLGPTAASIGAGVVYIGNRGDATLCVIDAKKMERGECIPASPDLSIRPDGVVYVAATKEVWISTRPAPGSNADAAKSLHVFDASEPRHLKFKTKIPLDGSAEGYAVDNQRGVFYTNIEETGTTVAIDVRTHQVTAKWNVGSTELQGLALDNARGFLFVACADHVVSLDIAHEGKVIDSIDTGAGLDNIDYSSERKVLYAAASQAAVLSIAEISDDGKFHLKATIPTIKGVRGVVAGKGETAYLIDPAEGHILKLTRKSQRSG